MDDYVNVPDLEGYISLRQAAKMLKLSRKRVYDFVMDGRIKGAKRVANVIAIPEEEIRNFKRQASGRERKTNPLWRFSTGENAQYMTTILVRMRAGKEKALLSRLREIKSSGEHLFPGTIARYVTHSEREAGRVALVLVWRGTVMPGEQERSEAIAAFQEALADVLDWSTAQYDHSAILMHT